MPSPIVTRALELAIKSTSLEEVRLQLLREGYFDVAAHIRLSSVKRKIMDRLGGLS